MIFLKNKRPSIKKQQSRRQSTNNVITVQPIKLPYREWHYGTCSCFEDCGECFCAYFCTLCYINRVMERTGEGCGSVICCGLVPARAKIRIERKIRGSIPDDFCSFVWCPYCTLIQMGLETRDTQALI